MDQGGTVCLFYKNPVPVHESSVEFGAGEVISAVEAIRLGHAWEAGIELGIEGVVKRLAGPPQKTYPQLVGGFDRLVKMRRVDAEITVQILRQGKGGAFPDADDGNL